MWICGRLNKYGTIKASSSSLFLEPTCEADVLDLIASMDPQKAAGSDGITVLSLRACGDIVAFSY